VNAISPLPVTPAELGAEKPIAIAILAMGGQGGGVLADWIVALAEREGWVAQSTSVPGVAQRTGATIYYLEIIKARSDARPVLALMPTPGDVDLVLAAELMEAGRSMLRGLVTPERTLLIASTHRSFAVGEKSQPGDGVGDPLAVVDAADFAARKTIAFDMEKLALENGSVISAAMFGALAASGRLPFGREAFEATIRDGGKGIEPSLRAFSAAFARAQTGDNEKPSRTPVKRWTPPPEAVASKELNGLLKRLRTEFPAAAHPVLYAGVAKLVDYQDAAYAGAYLDRLGALLRADTAARDYAFTLAAAKYLAVAMAYDDVIRVADLKIRSDRFARVRTEVGAASDQIVYTTEYMHPRLEEVCGMLPERLGRWIEARPGLYRFLDRRISKGRRVRTGTLLWFLALYVVAGMRGWRQGSLRDARERAHREAWLDNALRTLPVNYDLAVEVVACRRLVKGYSDTHARGLSKFDRTLSALPSLVGRDDGAAWLRRLREAALKDEDGVALDGVLKTVASL
jgi:indolepyruvate ferredoxin oxidoreductase beta subunit